MFAILYGPILITFKFSIYIFVPFFAVNGVLYGLQQVLNFSRPYPECVPDDFYSNGYPPHEVYLVSTVLVSIVYLLFLNYVNKKMNRNWRKRRRRTKSRLTRIYLWVLWAFYIIAIVTIFVSHPVLLIIIHCVSIAQAIVGVATGTIVTVATYTLGFVIYRYNKNVK